MKRLLLLLLISTIAFATIEESDIYEYDYDEYDEYDDVSLEGFIGTGTKVLGKVADKMKRAILSPKGPVRRYAYPTYNRLKRQMDPIMRKLRRNWQRTYNKKINPTIRQAQKTFKSKFEKPIKKAVIPRVNEIKKKVVVPLEKKFANPVKNRINKFLKDHPKIKKIADPFIKELKKVDPKKTLFDIINDPQNGGKIIQKTLKPFIDKVKSKIPFKKIKAELKNLENFMEKNKIPVKELKKLFVDTPVKAFNKLSQKARNGIYWLKKKGYWEPILFVVENVGQYAAAGICSMYLTPLVCEPAMELAFSYFVNPYLESI